MEDDRTGSAPSTPSARSIASSSALRLTGDAAVIGFAFLTGVVTARHLGPVGKGALSTLSYLVALAWPIAAFGAGEAAIALVGGRRLTHEEATRASIGLTLVAGSLLAPVVYAVTSIDAIGVSYARVGRLSAMLAVPFATLVGVLPHLVEMRGRFGQTLAARATGALVTFVATLYLVVTRQLDVAGAMTAALFGSMLTAAMLLLGLRRDGVSVRPSWNLEHLRRLVRVGVPVQLGVVAVVAAARSDLLVVAALRSGLDVGIYSVALTVSPLVTLVPVALAIAAAPRIAQTEGPELTRLVRRVLVTGTAAAAISALVLAAVVPALLPRAFGPGFRDAVGPTLALLPACLLQSVQWLAVRITSARGRTGAFVRAFVPTLVVMVALDLVLIRTNGLAGAAIAAVIANAVGSGFALLDVRTVLRRAALVGQDDR